VEDVIRQVDGSELPNAELVEQSRGRADKVVRSG
jgi:hypothetical protein